MTPVSRRNFLRGLLTATAAMAASSLGGASVLAQSGQPAGALPPSMKAVWDLSKAYRETTPTRELICINGLWRWHPAEPKSQQVPSENWGYFKVPGCWPGITDYMQKDSQTVDGHPSWMSQKLGDVTAAWYEREITIPTHWASRGISVCIEYLNSYAVVPGQRSQRGPHRVHRHYPCTAFFFPIRDG